MKLKIALPFLAAALLPALSIAVVPVPVPGAAPVSVTTTEIQGAAPAGTARIVKYFVAPAAKDSGFETGALHIRYDDKTEVVEALPPKLKAPPGDFVGNEVGFKDLKLAADGRTLGWSADYETDFAGYPLPLELAVYRSGKTILHFNAGTVLWYWEFMDGGRQAVGVWSPSHGPFEGEYQLYDTATGKLLDHASVDDRTQSLGADAPAWAKQAEGDCGRCGGVDRQE